MIVEAYKQENKKNTNPFADQRFTSRILSILVRAAAFFTVFILVFIILYILVRGVPHLKWSLFAWEYNTENVSLMPALINTITITLISLLISIPMGVCSAIYLAEYAKKGSRLVKLVRLTTETLSGIPSIIYGLFGFLLFVSQLKMGYSIIGGACTLSIMVLPTIMRTTEEALMSVPDQFREGSFGLGAGKLRTIFSIVLPSAIPGITSGVILAIGRIVGETAALIYTAGTVAGIPETVMESGRTLAIHMYVLSNEGLYTNEAYATAVVLLVIVTFINALSAYIAKRFGGKCE
ncbi:MAG: phosphate ABC transporter permease PstA [Eubacteriales bacterium]|nr:phosphate ABC transporter permease PstA [Eubacteriales bacterium]